MDRGITLCYILDGREYRIQETDENVKVQVHIVQGDGGAQERWISLENCSGREIFLKHAVLWSADSQQELGIGEGNCRVYRSGRHKNDMPGTFALGTFDESMGDVLGSMTESGDKAEAGEGSRRIISDHLTIFQGEEKSLCVEFPDGRKQLFETFLTLDETLALKKAEARVLWNVQLSAGKGGESERVRLVYTEDVEGEVKRFAVDKAERFGKRCGKHPAVFCTWYYYGLTVSYQDVKTNLDIMKEKGLPFDVFQLDEGWEITLGEWEANAKFPIPMEQLAAEIKEAGYEPGIWTSPFIAHETASIWKEHPEWKLLDKQGKPCLFPMNDTVYHVLDITNPATYEYFTELYRKLTFDWGYTYHKLDFTRAAVIYEDADFYDKTVTLAECYYEAVKAIRQGMGEEAYFLMCGGLYDPIIGLVDAQRTGSDVLSMWSSNINKGGKTAPYTIKQNALRYYMNEWWDNDPDALMIRINDTMERGLRLTYGLLNEEEVKTSVINQFMGGGLMCTTEPLDKISQDRLLENRRILPVLSREARPIKLLEESRFPGSMDVYIEEADVHYLCMINWEDEASKKVSFSIAEMLPGYAAPGERYIVCDYYQGKYYLDVDSEAVLDFEEILPHGGNVYKVAKMGDTPQVIASTGHYSMGGEFALLEMDGEQLRYVVDNPFDCTNQYKIWLPDGRIVSLEVGKGKQEGRI